MTNFVLLASGADGVLIGLLFSPFLLIFFLLDFLFKEATDPQDPYWKRSYKAMSLLFFITLIFILVIALIIGPFIALVWYISH